MGEAAPSDWLSRGLKGKRDDHTERRCGTRVSKTASFLYGTRGGPDKLGGTGGWEQGRREELSDIEFLVV